MMPNGVDFSFLSSLAKVLMGHAEMGAVVYSSGMCMDCYKEYLENSGGQQQGHNPPAYTRGLLKAKQVHHTLLDSPTTQGIAGSACN